MEFDFWNLILSGKVWKIMEKINQGKEKYLCFQTIDPIQFSKI